MIKECAWCGELYDTETGGRKYCSDECRHKRDMHFGLIRSRNQREAKKKKVDGIEEKLKYCREHNISYSEYQKQQTLKEQWR